jgi:malonate-semialdehyde dehydrogenase (acetylating)/methylmalonate-semialdehyde dehydrogenase
VSTHVLRITHLVNGKPWTGVAERTSPVYNPATGEVTGQLDLASAATVDEIVKTAREAWEEWADTSLSRRAQVLFAFRELLNARKEGSPGIDVGEFGGWVAVKVLVVEGIRDTQAELGDAHGLRL